MIFKINMKVYSVCFDYDIDDDALRSIEEPGADTIVDYKQVFCSTLAFDLGDYVALVRGDDPPYPVYLKQVFEDTTSNEDIPNRLLSIPIIKMTFFEILGNGVVEQQDRELLRMLTYDKQTDIIMPAVVTEKPIKELAGEYLLNPLSIGAIDAVLNDKRREALYWYIVKLPQRAFKRPIDADAYIKRILDSCSILYSKGYLVMNPFAIYNGYIDHNGCAIRGFDTNLIKCYSKLYEDAINEEVAECDIYTLATRDTMTAYKILTAIDIIRMVVWIEASYADDGDDNTDDGDASISFQDALSGRLDDTSQYQFKSTLSRDIFQLLHKYIKILIDEYKASSSTDGKASSSTDVDIELRKRAINDKNAADFIKDGA